METKKQSGNLFRTLYTTRIKMVRGETPILNLSVLFSIIALITAPWLVIAGVVVALIMGYRVSVNTSAVGFESSLEDVVQTGKDNVKKVFNTSEE